MDNNEFLIDHHHGTTANHPMSHGEDYEDHSHDEFKLSSSTGANNNLLDDGDHLLETTTSSSTGGVTATAAGAADGTFLVDEEEEAATTTAKQPFPPQSHRDDDISKPDGAGGVAVAPPPTQHSSSIDDFEFIGTPQSATDREVKMDNLLDFDSHSSSAPTAPPPEKPAGNLVETLLTGEDLKPHKDSTAAYLENEFAQFGAQTQEFIAPAVKPVKDVYNDFMEAERGAVHAPPAVDLMFEPSPEPVRKFEAAEKEPEKIETVSSTPIVAPAKIVKEEEQPQPKQVNYGHADDDLLEQFSAPAAPVNPIVAEEKKQMVIEEPKAATAPVMPAFTEDVVKAKAKEPEPEPEPAVVEVVKPKEPVKEVIKPTATPTPAAAAQNKSTAATSQKKDELITTSAEEMFCKFGLGECIEYIVVSLYCKNVSCCVCICGL